MTSKTLHNLLMTAGFSLLAPVGWAVSNYQVQGTISNQSNTDYVVNINALSGGCGSATVKAGQKVLLTCTDSQPTDLTVAQIDKTGPYQATVTQCSSTVNYSRPILATISGSGPVASCSVVNSGTVQMINTEIINTTPQSLKSTLLIAQGNTMVLSDTIQLRPANEIVLPPRQLFSGAPVNVVEHLYSTQGTLVASCLKTLSVTANMTAMITIRQTGSTVTCQL